MSFFVRPLCYDMEVGFGPKSCGETGAPAAWIWIRCAPTPSGALYRQNIEAAGAG